jgi:hypothetical protein
MGGKTCNGWGEPFALEIVSGCFALEKGGAAISMV